LVKKEKHIQEAQAKLKYSIAECKDIIGFGSQYFNSNKDVATNVWEVFCSFHSYVFYLIIILWYFPLYPTHQLTPKFEQPNNKIGISIDLSETILSAIEQQSKGVLASILVVLS
jgi:hypothetical protein